MTFKFVKTALEISKKHNPAPPPKYLELLVATQVAKQLASKVDKLIEDKMQKFLVNVSPGGTNTKITIPEPTFVVPGELTYQGQPMNVVSTTNGAIGLGTQGPIQVMHDGPVPGPHWKDEPASDHVFYHNLAPVPLYVPHKDAFQSLTYQEAAAFAIGENIVKQKVGLMLKSAQVKTEPGDGSQQVTLEIIGNQAAMKAFSKGLMVWMSKYGY